MNNLQIDALYKIINRTNGLCEYEGNYSECKEYFNKIGHDLSILCKDDPLYDDEGNYNAIESN